MGTSRAVENRAIDRLAMGMCRAAENRAFDSNMVIDSGLSCRDVVIWVYMYM